MRLAVEVGATVVESVPTTAVVAPAEANAAESARKNDAAYRNASSQAAVYACHEGVVIIE